MPQRLDAIMTLLAVKGFLPFLLLVRSTGPTSDSGEGAGMKINLNFTRIVEALLISGLTSLCAVGATTYVTVKLMSSDINELRKEVTSYVNDNKEEHIKEKIEFVHLRNMVEWHLMHDNIRFDAAEGRVVENREHLKRSKTSAK